MVDRRGRSDASQIAQSKQMLLRVQLTATNRKNLITSKLCRARILGATRTVRNLAEEMWREISREKTPSLFNHDTLERVDRVHLGIPVKILLLSGRRKVFHTWGEEYVFSGSNCVRR